MIIRIRIKHYVDGYERIVTLSEYDRWRRVEQELDRPVFEVIGIIINDKYINLKGGHKMINIKQILIDHNLPLPGTILYPPLDKVKGHKLLRYEIDNEGMHAVIDCNGVMELDWSLERVKQCTV